MSDEHIVKLGELDGSDGDWLGIRDGDTVALAKLGLTEGSVVGKQLGVDEVGNIEGFDVGYVDEGYIDGLSDGHFVG